MFDSSPQYLPMTHWYCPGINDADLLAKMACLCWVDSSRYSQDRERAHRFNELGRLLGWMRENIDE